MRRAEKEKRGQAAACLFLLFLITFFICLFIGAASLSFSDILAVFLGKGQESHRSILLYIRLPRVAACALSGSALAVSGVIIQQVLQNPLAGPNIIGVNAGAGFAVVLCSALFPFSYGRIPFAAFLGAFAAMLFIYGLAKRTGASKVTLVLAGVCVNSMLSAFSDVIHTLNEDTLTGTYSFRLGGFTSVSTKILFPAGILIVLGIAAAMLLGRELEILALGEQVASSVGLNSRRYRFLFLMLASLLAGASVSFAGLLSFVGLMAPHIAKRIIGEECRYLLPFSALFGGIFVMLCDLAARTMFAPYELPTGILLSLIGAPFFLWLLFSQKRRRSHD